MLAFFPFTFSFTWPHRNTNNLIFVKKKKKKLKKLNNTQHYLIPWLSFQLQRTHCSVKTGLLWSQSGALGAFAWYQATTLPYKGIGAPIAPHSLWLTPVPRSPSRSVMAMVAAVVTPLSWALQHRSSPPQSSTSSYPARIDPIWAGPGPHGFGPLLLLHFADPLNY